MSDFIQIKGLAEITNQSFIIVDQVYRMPSKLLLV